MHFSSGMFEEPKRRGKPSFRALLDLCFMHRCHTEGAADGGLHHHSGHTLSTERVCRAGDPRAGWHLQLCPRTAAPVPAPAGKPAGAALPSAAPPAAGDCPHSISAQVSYMQVVMLMPHKAFWEHSWHVRKIPVLIVAFTALH